MKHLKMLGLAAIVATALMAFVGVGTASATTLTGSGGAVLGKGSSIVAVSTGISKLTTSFKNIECEESEIEGTTENETGPNVVVRVLRWILNHCNCQVVILKKGSVTITATIGSNGSVSSNGAEITAECSSIFGNVHCIYVTENTALGTLTGGTPATMAISSAGIPRLSTNPLCDEESNWDANYKVTSPSTLNVTN